MVTDLCRWLRLRWYHTHDSRRSNAGFPDLVIVGPGEVIYAELKSERGRLSSAQAEWIEALNAAGTKAYVWRPSDMREISQILRDLARG